VKRIKFTDIYNYYGISVYLYNGQMCRWLLCFLRWKIIIITICLHILHPKWLRGGECVKREIKRCIMIEQIRKQFVTSITTAGWTHFILYSSFGNANKLNIQWRVLNCPTDLIRQQVQFVHYASREYCWRYAFLGVTNPTWNSFTSFLIIGDLNKIIYL